jgi:Arc/MetJ family transcription regulator
VTEVFDTFGNNQQASAVNQVFILLASVFPIITKIPTRRSNLTKKLSVTMGEISDDLLTRTRREKDVNVGERDEEKSIIGLLSALSEISIAVSLLTRRSVKSEGQDVELHMSEEEVVSQVRGDYIS